MSSTSDNAMMSPGTSPAEPHGVRRLNSWPIVIVGSIFAAFVLMISIIAYERSETQKSVAKEKEETGVISAERDALNIISQTSNAGSEGYGEIGAPIDSILNTSDMQQSISQDDLTHVENMQPTSAGSPNVAGRTQPNALLPPEQTNYPQLRQEGGYKLDPMEEKELERRIRSRKIDLFERAVTSRTMVDMAGMRDTKTLLLNDKQHQTNTGAPLTTEQMLAMGYSQNEIIQQKIAAIKGQTQSIPSAPNEAGLGTSDGNSTRWNLNNSVDIPKSAYELRAGYVLPATLVSGVNSDLPGKVIGQVSQNVYDTATGKFLLIPMGSRLLGEYKNEIAYGQERVMIAWQRILFPDGKALDIGAMPGTDGSGYSGFNDQVNHHFFRTFSSAILMSFIVAGVELSQDNTGSANGDRAGESLSQALGQQLGDVLGKMIEKNLNIAPTIEIRPGYRFNVMVTKDLTFDHPYQAFDY